MLAVLAMLPVGCGWLTQTLFNFGEINDGTDLWHNPMVRTLLKKISWQGNATLAETVGSTVLPAVLSRLWFDKYCAAAKRVR